jgi:hypothetical protein
MDPPLTINDLPDHGPPELPPYVSDAPIRGCSICERPTRHYTVILGRDVCDDCKRVLDNEAKVAEVFKPIVPLVGTGEA